MRLNLIFKFSIYWLLAVQAGCSGAGSTPKTAASSDAFPRNSKADEVQLFIADVAGSEPLNNSDAISKLQIESFSITNFRNGSELVGFMSLFGSKIADYAEIQISASTDDCSDEKACLIKKTPLTTLALPALKSGRHVVKVRACVNEVRAPSPGNACGPWNIDTYTQPSNEFDSADLDSLKKERDRYVAELRSLSKELSKTLKDFEKDSEKCDKRAAQREKLDGYKILVGNFLRLGDMLIEKAVTGSLFNSSVADDSRAQILQADNSPGGPAVGDPSILKSVSPATTSDRIAPLPSDIALVADGSPRILRALPYELLRKNLLEAKRRLASDGPQTTLNLDSLSYIRNIGTASGLLGSNTGVGAIGILGGAIFDIATADGQAESVAMCLADTQHNRRMAALKVSIVNTKQRIADLNRQIARDNQ